MADYECSACGRTFASDEPAPRCPKCLRQTSVKELGEEDDVDSSPSAPAEAEATPEEKRRERLLVLLFVPALAAAFLRGGFFHFRLATPPALAIAGVGAIAWATLAYRAPRERLRAGISGIVSASGMVLAIAWYIGERTMTFSIEVLLPILVGALPGLIVHVLLRRLVPDRQN